MPRPPETPGEPARNRIQVLLTDNDLAVIDDSRGTQSLSQFCRVLIRGGLGAGKNKHIHTRGEMLSTTTVAGKTTTYYHCAGCADEIEETS